MLIFLKYVRHVCLYVRKRLLVEFTDYTLHIKHTVIIYIYLIIITPLSNVFWWLFKT